MKVKSYKNNNDTKKEALEMAKNYLQTLGFNGFSFQTIADALGIRKASLHYYFASKEDLGIALLKDYETAHNNWCEKVKDLSSKEKLEKFSRIFTKMGENDWLVCPTGVLSTDFNTLPAKMRKKLKDFHLMQREWVIETLDQGKKERTIKSNLDTKATADWIMSTMQGGVQLARLRNEKDIPKKMITLLLENIYE